MFNSLKCMIKGHAITETQNLSITARRIACKQCGKMFAMNDSVQVVADWTPEFHTMYEELGVDIVYKDWEK